MTKTYEEIMREYHKTMIQYHKEMYRYDIEYTKTNKRGKIELALLLTIGLTLIAISVSLYLIFGSKSIFNALTIGPLFVISLFVSFILSLYVSELISRQIIPKSTEHHCPHCLYNTSKSLYVCPECGNPTGLFVSIIFAALNVFF